MTFTSFYNIITESEKLRNKVYIIMKKKTLSYDVKKLTYLALMTALVALFQTIGMIIPIGFNVGAFSLVPIVIGGAMLGPAAGAWLGFSSAAVLIATNAVAPYYTISIFFTILVVILKGVVSGWVAALVYMPLSKKNSLLAITVSSVLCPVVNTSIFLVACFTVFFPGLSAWAIEAGKDMISFVFVTMVGINFFVEVGICVLFAPIADRMIKLGSKMRHDKS